MGNRALTLIVLFAIGCGGTAGGDAVVGADTGSADTGGDGGSDGDGGAEISDEDVARAAISGDRDAAEVLAEVAASGGWPVETDAGTFLFACLCGDGDWTLAGDHDDWAGQVMARTDGGLLWAEVTVPNPDGSLYKYNQGDIWTSDPHGRRFNWDEFGAYSLVRASAPHLERLYGVEGEGLQPRDLQVWVPQDGVVTHTLFAHDGQNLFDPEGMWGGWRLQEALPSGVLVVGIDNTSARMDEYTHTTDDIGEVMGGQGDAYAALVEGTIRPLAASQWGEGAVVGVMGSSLGGLISFYIADRYPGRYDMAISLSGTMGWGSIGLDNATMIDLYADAGHRDTALYLDSGGSGECWDADGDGIQDDDPQSADNYCENAQLRDVLSDAGYTFEVDLWHWHEPDAPHNELAWADRVWRPIELFAGVGADR